VGSQLGLGIRASCRAPEKVGVVMVSRRAAGKRDVDTICIGMAFWDGIWHGWGIRYTRFTGKYGVDSKEILTKYEKELVYAFKPTHIGVSITSCARAITC
jgi:hypothetical protein